MARQFFKPITISIICGSISIFLSCNNTPSGNNKVLSEADSYSFKEEKLNYFKFRFPSSNEMFYYIKGEILKYDNSLLNPASNVESYLTTYSQAMNLGIYLSDLSYISITRKWEDANRYFNTVYLLMEKLHLSTAYNRKIIERVESNLEDVDSLINISLELNNILIDHLVETDNEKLYGIIAFGSLTEYFYLSLNAIDPYSESNIIAKATDYKYIIDNLSSFLLFYEEDNSNIKTIISKLKLYSSYFIEDKSNKTTVTTVEKLDDGTLVLKGGKKFIITQTGIDSLNTIISKNRLLIINNEF